MGKQQHRHVQVFVPARNKVPTYTIEVQTELLKTVDVHYEERKT